MKPERLLIKHNEQTRESWDQMVARGRSATRPPARLRFLITKGFAFQVLSQSRHF